MQKVLLARHTIFFLLLIHLYGCRGDNIGNIVNSPEEYIGKEVRIEGEVDLSADLLVVGVYRVRDKSGMIWVLSKFAVPKQGEKITVKGKVEYISEWIRLSDNQNELLEETIFDIKKNMRIVGIRESIRK